MWGMHWSRREFVLAAGAGGALGLDGAASAKAALPRIEDTAADPRRSNAGILKLMASLGPEPSPWWFAGLLYAQVGESKPRPFVRCEGCEEYLTVRQPDGSYLMHGRTLTFFRDVETREWIDAFDNPLTGRRSEVKPNILKSDGPGGFVYPADGSAGYFSGPMGSMGQLAYQKPAEGAAAAKPAPPKGELSWHVVGEQVLATTNRAIETPAQPWVETSTMFTSRAAFFDPAVRSTPACGVSTYLSPWLRWMDMEGVPGHLVWHASSVKLAALEELPPAYRQRAEAMKLFDTLVVA